MTDGQGTTKLVTSSSQTITSTQETEAFGRTIATTGSTSNPFGYHGAEGYRQDGDGPAGLEPYQKVGARYYDPTFGRFITRDTDLGQSPYAYCGGDPVNNSDPSGHLSAVNIASGGIAIAGEIDGAASAPVDTSGDNTSSSSSSATGSTDPGGSNPGGGAGGGSGGSSTGSSGSTGAVSVPLGGGISGTYKAGANGTATAGLTNGIASVTASLGNNGAITGFGGGFTLPLGTNSGVVLNMFGNNPINGKSPSWNIGVVGTLKF